MREVDERNGFRHSYNTWASERAEASEAEVVRRRVGARVRAAETAAVRERVLDLSDAPAFLVKHWIVDDTADGELGILLDGIVLEIFVAAIAIEQVTPLGIAGANAAAAAPTAMVAD